MSAVSVPTVDDTQSYSCSSSCYSSDSESDDEYHYKNLVRKNGSLFMLQYKRDWKLELIDRWGQKKKPERLQPKQPKCRNSRVEHANRCGVRAMKAKRNAAIFLNEKSYEQGAFTIEIVVSESCLSRFGRRCDLLELLFGLRVSRHDIGSKVIVTGLSNSKCEFVRRNFSSHEVQIGDWLCAINAQTLTYQNYNNVIRKCLTNNKLLILNYRRPVRMRAENPLVQSGRNIRYINTFDNYLLDKTDFMRTIDTEKVSLMYVHIATGTTQFCYPDNDREAGDVSIAKFLHAKKNVLLTLVDCLRARETYDKQPWYTVMETTGATASDPVELLAVFYWKATDANVMFLCLPLPDESVLPRFETLFEQLVNLVLFAYGDFDTAFVPSQFHRGPDIQQLLSLFFAKFYCQFGLDLTNTLDLKMDRADDDERFKCVAFEDIVENAGIVPIPREQRMQINDALTEFEAADFRDLDIKEKAEQQKLFIMGSCFYHNGYLLVSHLNESDLRQVHTYLRTINMLELSRIVSLRNLVVWHEIYPSSRHKRRDVGANVPARNYGGNSNFSTFLLIIGYDHDLVCAIVETSVKKGCVMLPHDWYVENAEDTVRHIHKMNVTFMADNWVRFTFEIGPNQVLMAAKYGALRTAAAADSDADDAVSGASSASSKWTLLTLGSSRKSVSSGGYLNDDVVVNSADDDDDDDDFCDLLESESCNEHEPEESLVGCGDGATAALPRQLKLNSGSDSILLHFVKLDKFRGVMVCSSSYDKGWVRKLYDRFRNVATEIHQKFHRKVVGAMDELALSFNLYTTNCDRQFQYWVVGKKLLNGDEFYFCHQDTVPQNVLDLVYVLNSISLD